MDIHDLKFGQSKMIQIADTEVFVHRLGMSGALAYEIHGAPENGDKVYEAVIKAGEKYGAVRQGIKTYPLNHTQGGYPNQCLHFAYPDENGKPMFDMPLTGSAADKVENAFVTPYDLGWGKIVNFDHEFPGKAALQKAAVTSRTVPVTIEWNIQDVMDIYTAEFLENGTEADEGIFDYDDHLPEWRRVHMDYVEVDGKKIGLTSGRIKDFYHKTFISLGFIDQDYIKERTEVTVLWGKVGKAQRDIRAKVAKFPYYDGEWRNETCDVMEKVPHRFIK